MNRGLRTATGIGTAILFFIWLFATILFALAIGAVAGDVLGLWEVVKFV